MENLVIFTQIMEKEERELLYYPAKKATHYFEYCDEVGCDVWGKLLEIENPLYEPIGLWLPQKYRVGETSEYVQGVEVSPGFGGRIPEGLESVKLHSGTYMVFQSEPYEETIDRMIEVIQSVQKAIKSYKPELYGWEWAAEDAPRYQLTPLGERGYIEAVPVRRTK